jgi:hypothetical protein
MVFIVEIKSVYCAVKIGPVDKTDCVSSSKNSISSCH